ncbi:hypothetical protein ACO0LC_18705 [Undibacterium sp. JH2W]|uniref:hypothetical protein n=1 Tax=Undibacterium sp. JH2W TaxID=3413037 RepID=UPI003BF14170
MKFIYHLISRPLALLGVAFMFCSSQAHAGYVEPTYAYGYQILHKTLDSLREAIISSMTNGTMQSDYWRWEDGIFPYFDDRTPTTINGGARSFYVLAHPTQRAIKEGLVPPGDYKWIGGLVSAICPDGYTKIDSADAFPAGPDFHVACFKPEPCNCDKAGNPVLISSGTKTETAVDYQGAPGLEFVRNYRSDRQGWTHNYAVKGFDTGSAASVDALKNYYEQLPCIAGIDQQFKQSYCFKQVSPNFAYNIGTHPNEFILIRGNDPMRAFGTANNYNPLSDNNDRVTKIFDAGGAATGWSVYNSSDESTEYFDLKGYVVKIVERGGMQKLFTYSDITTPVAIAQKPGLLIRVTNHFGQQLNFTYRGDRMLTMIDPAGGVTTYAYDEASSLGANGTTPKGNLTSVTYPDSKKRVYWYNEQDKTKGTDLAIALTGITDENGVRFATWTYDEKGRATSSEHAGGVEKYTFTPAGYLINPTHTDPLGVVWEHYYVDVQETKQLGYKKRIVGSESSQIHYTYDYNGNAYDITGYRGQSTTRTFDNNRNLELTRTEATSRSEAQTTTTSWHPAFRIPVQINAPLLRISYSHDLKGNVLTKTEQATTDTNGSQGASAPVTGSPRTWTYTYNDIGQVLTVTGPRTDVVDKTTYTYDNLGNLNTVTNPLGHVTILSNYDANSRVGQITDANGMVTNLSYTPRGWLKQRTTNADGVTETTVYDHDNVGQMTKVTLPDNSSISYTYDDAHRLTKISDSLGNSINYTLDVMGNRTNETVTDASGTLSRQVSRVYDLLNRLQKVTGAAQ